MLPTCTPEELVAELYRGLLNREPDPAGLSSYATMLANATTTLAELITLIIHSDEFRGRAQQLIPKPASAHAQRFTNDVSKHGEIPMLLNLWVNSTAAHRIVVDVGAGGLQGSNSHDLLRHFHWKGLLVQAHPYLIPSIRRDFQDLDMTVVNCAASDQAGIVEVDIVGDDGAPSLNPDPSDSSDAAMQRIQVPVVRLGPLLQAHAIPAAFDLLSLDTGGSDVQVLDDLLSHSGYAPRWVILGASDQFHPRTVEDPNLLPDTVRTRYRIAAHTQAYVILALIPQ